MAVFTAEVYVALKAQRDNLRQQAAALAAQADAIDLLLDQSATGKVSLAAQVAAPVTAAPAAAATADAGWAYGPARSRKDGTVWHQPSCAGADGQPHGMMAYNGDRSGWYCSKCGREAPLQDTARKVTPAPVKPAPAATTTATFAAKAATASGNKCRVCGKALLFNNLCKKCKVAGK